MPDDRTVEASGDLLRLVESAGRGDDVVITRGGRPVARLVPEPPRPRGDEIDAVARRIEAFAARPGLPAFDWDEWSAYRDDGRR